MRALQQVGPCSTANVTTDDLISAFSGDVELLLAYAEKVTCTCAYVRSSTCACGVGALLRRKGEGGKTPARFNDS